MIHDEDVHDPRHLASTRRVDFFKTQLIIHEIMRSKSFAIMNEIHA